MPKTSRPRPRGASFAGWGVEPLRSGATGAAGSLSKGADCGNSDGGTRGRQPAAAGGAAGGSGAAGSGGSAGGGKAGRGGAAGGRGSGAGGVGAVDDGAGW